MDFGVGGGLGVESRAPGGGRLGVELRLWTGLWDVGYLQHFRRRNASASLIASVGGI